VSVDERIKELQKRILRLHQVKYPYVPVVVVFKMLTMDKEIKSIVDTPVTLRFLLRTLPLEDTFGISDVVTRTAMYLRQFKDVLTISELISYVCYAIRNPVYTSVIVSGWEQPWLASTSNNYYTTTVVVNAEQQYWGYGTFGGDSVDSVVVCVEGYGNTTVSLQVGVYHTGDGLWYWQSVTVGTAEEPKDLDFTGVATWTINDLNNIQVRMRFLGEA